jgi:hypothetical protein
MQFDDKVTFEVFFEADWHGNSDLNKILSDLGVVAGDFDSAGRRQYEHRAWWRQKSQSTEVVLRTTSYGLLVLATQQRMRVNNIRFADDVSYSRIKWIKELCVQGNEQCLETDRDSKRASEKVLTRERLRLLNLDLFGQGMKGPVKRMLANTMTSIGRYKLSFTRGLVDDEETIALIESVIKDRLTFVRGRATPISCNITIADAFFLASLRNVSMVEDFATYSDINRRIVGILD